MSNYTDYDRVNRTWVNSRWERSRERDRAELIIPFEIIQKRNIQIERYKPDFLIVKYSVIHFLPNPLHVRVCVRVCVAQRLICLGFAFF